MQQTRSLMEATCFSTNEEKILAYAQIQHEIELMKQAILDLKTRHNSLSLIARLPNEILGKVFTWLMQLQRKNKETPWIRVSFVSSHWRHVALDCPHLWSRLHGIRSEEWLSLLVSRSGAVPLCVLFKADYGSDTRFGPRGTAVVTPQMHRVRKIVLKTAYNADYLAPVNYGDGSFRGPFQINAPLIDTLDILSSRAPNSICLADNLFSGVAPLLRKMYVRGCIFSPNFVPLASLTQLTLDDIDWGLSSLLRTLGNARNLKQLSLYIPPGKGHPRSDDIPTIELPCLKKIRFFCHLLQSHVIILSHMQCPEVTSFCLHFHPKYVPQSVSISQHAENIEKLASLIAARFHVSNMDVESGPRYHIIKLQARRQASASHTTISIHFSRVEGSNDLFLGSLCKGLPLDNIKRLRVSESAFSARVWLPLFGHLQCLESIVLWPTPMDIISTLNTRSSQDGDPEGEGPSEMGALGFKALQRLTIYYWNFNENDADALWACIEARHAHNVGLKVLRFQECKFHGKSTTSSNLLDSLKSVVAVVEWDVEHVSTGILEEDEDIEGGGADKSRPTWAMDS